MWHSRKGIVVEGPWFGALVQCLNINHQYKSLIKRRLTSEQPVNRGKKKLSNVPSELRVVQKRTVELGLLQPLYCWHDNVTSSRLTGATTPSTSRKTLTKNHRYPRPSLWLRHWCFNNSSYIHYTHLFNRDPLNNWCFNNNFLQIGSSLHRKWVKKDVKETYCPSDDQTPFVRVMSHDHSIGFQQLHPEFQELQPTRFK